MAPALMNVLRTIEEDITTSIASYDNTYVFVKSRKINAFVSEDLDFRGNVKDYILWPTEPQATCNPGPVLDEYE